MTLRFILSLVVLSTLSSCVAPPPPPPPPAPYCPPKKAYYCPPKKPVAQNNGRLRNVNGRTIEDVPAEEVEPAKNVLKIVQ